MRSTEQDAAAAGKVTDWASFGLFSGLASYLTACSLTERRNRGKKAARRNGTTHPHNYSIFISIFTSLSLCYLIALTPHPHTLFILS